MGHIRSHIYDDLQDVRRVIRTLGSIDHEVLNPATETRCIMRISDVTPLTWAQQAMRDSAERFRAMVPRASGRMARAGYR